MKRRSLKMNAFLNALKNGCSILFPFITFVYCSRILGAEVIGKVFFGQSIIGYMLLLAGLGISNYAIREGASIRENPAELNNFIDEIFSINIISTVISYIVLVLIMCSVDKLSNYSMIIFIQSFQILLTLLGVDWINSIVEDYLYLALRYIIFQIIALVLLFIFVRSPKDLYNYTFIMILANAGGNIMNIFYIKRKKMYPKFVITSKMFVHLIPICILFFNNIATVLYLNSDVTMLGWIKSDYDVGIYTISSKIYTMSKTLINAIIMVTLPRFSYYIANNMIDRYNKISRQIFELLMVFTAPIMIGIFMEAKNILLFVGGSEYLEGIDVLKILSISLPFAIYACFFSYSILLPYHKEKIYMYSTLLAAILNFILNLVCIPLWGINGAAITTLLAEIVVCVITFKFARNLIIVDMNFKLFVIVLLGCLEVILICKFLNEIVKNNILCLVISIICSSICYGLTVYLGNYKNVFMRLVAFRKRLVFNNREENKR